MMDPSDHTSPSHNFFDPASILSSAAFGPASVTSSLAFPHLAHMPSAFSMLGHPPGFPIPPSFGGLGVLGDGLTSPLRHSLNHAAAAPLLHTFGSSPVFGLSAGKNTVTKSSTTVATTTTSSVRTCLSSSSRSSHMPVTSSTNAHSKSKQRSKQRQHPAHRESAAIVTSLHREPGGPLGLHIPLGSSSSSSISPSSLVSSSQSHRASTSTTTTTSTKSTAVVQSHTNTGGHKHGLLQDKNMSPVSSQNLKKVSATDHQIDNTKKKLLAEQIRQKMKSILTPLQTPVYKPELHQPRAKGRPPKQLSTAVMDMRETNSEDKPLQLVKKSVHHNNEELSMYRPLDLKTPISSSAHVPGVKNKSENGDSKSSLLSSSYSANGQNDSVITKYKLMSDKNSSNSSSSDEDSDSGSESDSSDSSDSGSCSDSMESDDDQSTRDSENSSTSFTTGDKRTADISGNGSGTSAPVKKRRVIDEKELRIPLEHSWQRQTKIRGIGKRGIIGEVMYHAPCGKKLRTYSDVMRYLEKNGITDLCKENFSFSTKAPIGEFFEQRHGENGYVLLSEHEVFDRFTQVQFNRRRRRNLDPEALALKKKRKEEKYEAAQQAAELKMQRKLERQKQKEMAKKVKQIKENAYKQVRWEQHIAIERKQMKEQEKQVKQQEKLKRQEQLRMEREIRAQQVLEEREMKRQQAVMMREQVSWNLERERRRQHMLLVKSLEARRRQEERERLKEEKQKEKLIERERKLNQRRVELQIAAELKKPIEDMEIKDIKELPQLPRIEGVCLAGNAFADALMVLEFMHNFAKALSIPEDFIPDMTDLQNCLMGDKKEDLDKYTSYASKLLKIALTDPGVPNPKEAVTALGQKIVDIELDDTMITEVLRIFIISRNNGDNEISEWLSEKPLNAFNATQKASVLAFLCNELLCGRLLSNEVEKTIESMSTLRRDKWIVEGKLRRLRIIQAKKYNRPSPKISLHESSSPLLDEDSHATNVSGSKQGSDEEEDSGNDSDITTVTSVGIISEGEEEDPINSEDCEKKIEKLQRQHSQYQHKVFEASHKLRAVSFGQDRFKRRYWLLPYCGRLFVEGLESGAMGSEDEEEEETGGEDENEIDYENNEDTESKSQTGSEDLKDSIKKEPKSEDEEEEDEEEMDRKELMDCKLSEPIANSTPVKCESPKTDHKSNSKNSISHVKEENPTNLFLQKPEATKFSDLIHISKPDGAPTSQDTKSNIVNSHHDSGTSPTTSSSVNTSSPNNSTLSTHSDTKPSFVSIDSLLKKDHEPSSPTLPFVPSMATYPMPPIFTDQLLKTASEINDQKPWFSILPRMPCDETSLTRSPLNISHRMLNNSPFIFQPMPFHAFPVRSPAFASFQMGQIQSNPVDFNMNMFNNNTNNSNTYFKVPPVPQEASSMNNSSSSSLLQNSPLLPVIAPTSNGNGLIDSDPEGLLKSLQGELKPIPKAMKSGWWYLADPEHLKGVLKCLHPRGIREKNLQKALQKYFDQACQACKKDMRDELKIQVREEFQYVSTTGAPPPDLDSSWMSNVAHQLENSVMETIGKLEERVFSASLQVKLRDKQDGQNCSVSAKGSKLPPKPVAPPSESDPPPNPGEETEEQKQSFLEDAQKRLLKLERNIERRYLKPPLCKKIQISLSNIALAGENQNSSHENRKDEGEEDVPPGLLTWRNAVHSAKSVAQLSICANFLINSIAWEKSIMKVLCQICRKDDNEAELLLCDGCDKGYHTYCFKPKMETIPDGDWYCYECISKATGVPCCVACGKKNGKLATCDECPRAFHIDCLIPPLQRLPKKWLCASCVAGKGTKKSKRGRKKKEETIKKEKKNLENSKSDEEKKKEQFAKEMACCKTILLELEKNKNGWPFLQPVNLKQFPSYKKYIKKPMDFNSMKIKLRDNQYKSKDQFAADTHLIFDNCEIFNEDDSEVGNAGHALRRYFIKRWNELLGDNKNQDEETSTTKASNDEGSPDDS
ncbi:bromodomain adjacent to zinc finger domain protein 2B isoform X3 [Octopus sinensis]|uniref:Bromodomain adjacent to zinc finger domain protein 2B isoform X3 n=1 Tax=Octopus sinensis TaxID=2607531 RepID=A0A6P7TAU8_9MOLL|nr:bromodomain adjacent to zinc finger domain protein 2B isoform X3 [Octopus sinensis]